MKFIQRIILSVFLIQSLAQETLLAQTDMQDEPAEEPTQQESASGDPEKSADSIARELANPNTPLASLTFRNQYRWYTGDLPDADKQSNYTMLFQPVLPFPLKNGNKITVRPGIPLISSQPVISGSGLINAAGVTVPQSPSSFGRETRFGSESGLGDIGLDVLYGISTDTGLIYGWGAFMSMPTATEDTLGSDRWTIGPDLMLGKVTNNTVMFGLLSHQVDFAGSGDREINLTTMTLAAIYLPSGGWNVGTSPIINYDWESENWTIPLNFAVGKTVMLANRPWKLQAEINYYVKKPDLFGAEWMIAFNITPVVKNTLARFFE